MEDQKIISFQDLKNWKESTLITHQFHADELHLFHEKLMKTAFQLVHDGMTTDYGAPPCDFSWFVTGSAGRCEQAIISDQDHGIIFARSTPEIKEYFLTFGERITTLLEELGYPRCEGKVMSSNPVWCQSIAEWEAQMNGWIQSNTWETIRYVLIFMDSRSLIGNEEFVAHVKSIIYRYIDKNPSFVQRLLDNTKHTVKAIGVLNQFITIQSGPHTGCIDYKQAAIFPYVNAIRLLAIMEGIEETSTLQRMKKLSKYEYLLEVHYEHFVQLLHLRLLDKNQRNYHDSRYIKITSLEKHEKKNLKLILKDLETLQKQIEVTVKRLIRDER